MNRKGFTLVELLVTVLILGALAAITVPRIIGSTFRTKVNVCRTNVDLINSKIELYHLYTGSWPSALKDVTADPNYFPDGPPQCPFRTPYVLDRTKDKNRVPDHLHPTAKEAKVILNEDEDEDVN